MYVEESGCPSENTKYCSCSRSQTLLVYAVLCKSIAYPLVWQAPAVAEAAREQLQRTVVACLPAGMLYPKKKKIKRKSLRRHSESNTRQPTCLKQFFFILYRAANYTSPRLLLLQCLDVKQDQVSLIHVIRLVGWQKRVIHSSSCFIL